MGGIKVEAESQMTTVPGLFAAGECAAGLHGANRLGGNSLSDLLVFGKRAGQFAAKFAQEHKGGQINEDHVNHSMAQALEPMDRQADQAETPYAIQAELQERMQELVGIVRQEEELEQAVSMVQDLKARAQRVVVPGNREYNPGWHTAIDLDNLLIVSEAVALSARERKESRGAHTRIDYPDKDSEFAKVNTRVRRGDSGQMEVAQEPLTPTPADLQEIIDEENR
jgi:succinate dehydrogenase / fumarate reductase flavoprotein subunit